MNTKEPETFTVTFVRAGAADHPIERAMNYGLCPVTFAIRRGKQNVEFTVYVDVSAHAPEDYIKAAQHQLHHDLARLTEQTRAWDQPGLVISKATMIDDGSDLPF